MDQLFMKQALEQAKQAFSRGEVPVGALIVYNNEVIAAAHNRVEELQDATAHAEILAIQQASRHLGNWRLLGATLYCTLEPCALCASAMLLARLARLIYAAPDLRFGAAGSHIDLFAVKHPTHTLKVERGECQEEAAELMRSFFRERRGRREE